MEGILINEKYSFCFSDNGSSRLFSTVMKLRGENWYLTSEEVFGSILLKEISRFWITSGVMTRASFRALVSNSGISLFLYADKT